LESGRLRSAVPAQEEPGTQAQNRPRATSPAPAVLRALRPKQWIKNGFVAAALVFSGHLRDPSQLRLTAWAVAVFCLLSSAGYLMNDVVDADRDRAHPVKRFRPIAAGDLSPPAATVIAAALTMTGILGAVLLGKNFAFIAVAYVSLSLAYSLILKRSPVLELLIVAGGFVLRAASGAAAIDVPMSWWLGLLTFLLALFVLVGKRRSDGNTEGYAPAISYPRMVLDRSLVAIGFAVVALYGAYAVAAANLPRDHVMLLTLPFVGLGLWRYGAMVTGRSRRAAGWDLSAPEETLLRDPFLYLTVAAWIATSIIALYVMK
jgi:4-hydroxybenzoate polyprenyltransferase